MRENEYDLETEDSTESDQVRDASREVIARLTSLRVWMDGSERAEDLVQMMEAIERFEEAVQAKGGDLMIDEPAAGGVVQPDVADFALPARASLETVSAYLQRLARATQVVQQSPALE